MKIPICTPGPWKSRRFGDWWTILRRDDPHGRILADVFNERDVPIVKALPELIEACEIALKELEASASTEGRKARVSPAYRAIRAALGRASGKRQRTGKVATQAKR